MTANIASNMLELIGNTPLVRLNKLAEGLPAEVVVKLEMFNPTGSVKDRPALAMLEAAESTGKIKPDAVLIEPTSGNTGIGLAFICAVKGWRLILTMPESMSLERRAMLAALGAELMLTPAAKGMRGAVEAAEKYVAEHPGSILVGQFINPANPAMHRKTTAEEIWRDTGGEVDVFAAAVGTGGTLSGAGGRLKELNPELKVVAVEPAESPVLSGGVPGPHGIQGIGAGFVPEVLDRAVIDEVMTVSLDEALATARRLMREEGILGGISSGANVAAALKLAADPKYAGKRIVTIICDLADRYISTALFTG